MAAQRVLIVNKFYYRRGGDCIHALGLERMLRERGHEVAVLATAHPLSLTSEWSAYWPAAVDFADGSPVKAAARMLGVDGMARRVRRLLSAFRPDVVHLHNIHSHLSPVVAREARRAGCRVVWTLHDYKLVCPAYTMLCRGRVCSDCRNGGWAVVRKRCFRNSLGASLAARAESLRWSRAAVERWTDMFICPSEFMGKTMELAGYNPARLKVIPNFWTPNPRNPEMTRPEAGELYYCYAGRIAAEKGLDTLLRAAAGLPYRLKIAGDGPQFESLRARYGSNGRVEWLGQLGAEATAALIEGARLSVVPSEWNENCPLSVIESLCAGTPVVASRMGGIPELLDAEPEMTRMFAAADAKALAAAVSDLWTQASADEKRRRMAMRARRRFSPEAYYRQLAEVYASA